MSALWLNDLSLITPRCHLQTQSFVKLSGSPPGPCGPSLEKQQQQPRFHKWHSGDLEGFSGPTRVHSLIGQFMITKGLVSLDKLRHYIATVAS